MVTFYKAFHAHHASREWLFSGNWNYADQNFVNHVISSVCTPDSSLRCFQFPIVLIFDDYYLLWMVLNTAVSSPESISALKISIFRFAPLVLKIVKIQATILFQEATGVFCAR